MYCCHFHSDPKVVFTFGGGEGDILLDNVQCSGNETNLLQCKHNEIREHNCYHYKDAGISCGNVPLHYIFKYRGDYAACHMFY